MGRNGNSWAKIGLFYICFYAFLAGFFAAMLSVFLTTISKPGEGPPKLTQYIANKPGLTIVNPVLAGYNVAKPEDLKSFTDKVEDHINKYGDKGYSPIPCDVKNVTGYEGKVPCTFSARDALGPNCTKSNNFGLKEGRPCILVKMNKVYDWVPAGDSEYLELDCGKTGNVINKGYMKAAMPFRGQKFYTNPIAVVQVHVKDEPVEVRCTLVGEKIEVSDSFNPKRAFGKIEFTVAAPTKT